MVTALKFLALLFMGPTYNRMTDCVKEHVLKASQQLIRSIQVFLFVRIFLAINVAMLVVGFVLLPLALYLYLPWSVSDKAILLIVFGSVYIAVPLIMFLVFFSSSLWLKMIKKESHHSSITRRT